MNTNLDTSAPADRQLVDRCLDGDHTAYRLIVERHQGMVCALAFSACGDVTRSEEVAQEVFIAAWRNLSNLQDADKLPGWLAGITRNLVRNSYRHQLRTPTDRAEVLAPELVAEETGPREKAISADEAGLMWRALESIPEKYREPMVLYYREQRSVEAVAHALDISEENVRQRLVRGRALLTERVERMVGDDSVVYLLGFAKSRAAARQLVNHGHVRVNGRKVDIASYNVVQGDEVEIRGSNSSRQLATRAIEENRARVVPGWLVRNDEALKGTITRLPTRDEMEPSINEQLIVEYYSRF